MSGQDVNLGSPSQVSVHVNNQDAGGQAGGFSVDKLMTFVMNISAKNAVEGVEEKNLDSINELKISFKTTDGGKFTIDISNPQVGKANEEMIEGFMVKLTLEGSDGKADPNREVVMKLTEGIDGLKAVTSTAAAGDVGKSQTCAFLGGLTMVALSEILANYAKVESTMKKLSSVLFLSTQACMLDIAESIAKNIEQKAKDQAMAKIAEACISAFSAGMQIGGSLKAMDGLKDRPAYQTQKDSTIEKVDVDGNKIPVYQQAHTKDGTPMSYDKDTALTDTIMVKKGDPVLVRGDDGQPIQAMRPANASEVQIATIQNSMVQVVGQFSQAANNSIEAWSILEAGHIDAQNTILEALKDQMGKMQDSFKGIENSSDQRLNDILDTLKNFFTNLAQAFKSITGR